MNDNRPSPTNKNAMTNTNAECPNCTAICHGRYCSECGQDQKSGDKYFWTLINEAFEGIFNWNSKAWITTFALFFKPGFLTSEHFKNRRARYVSPLRLYLITSVAFFLTLSLVNFFSLGGNILQIQDSQTTTSPAQAAIVDIDAVDEVNSLNHNAFEQRLIEQIKKTHEIATTEPKRIVSKVIDNLPIITLLLLPIYALVLKLFHLKSNRYYVEHLVLVVHNSSFIFAAYILVISAQLILNPAYKNWCAISFAIWAALYFSLSYKRIYQQPWPLTIFKFFATSIVNSAFALIGLTLVLLASIMLL